MHFTDLDFCTYGGRQGTMLAVGWLEKGKPISYGLIPDGLIARLREMAAKPMRLYRGSHRCDLCKSPGRDSCGNGEIQVTDSMGRTMVAPVLIVHYVEVHGYRPPKAFIDAVMAKGEG